MTRRFDDETMRQAREADLHDYLTSCGEHFKRYGKEWRLDDGTENPSIQVKGNRFKNFRTGEEGDTVKYLELYCGFSFVNAVKELTGGGKSNYIAPPRKPQPIEPEPPKVLVLTKGANNHRTFAYLTKTRMISKKVVEKYFGEHLLSQDADGNAVFRWLDEAGNIVGADRAGTGTKRFKSIAPGSNSNYGFCIKIGEVPTKLLIFEAPIDALSYVDLFGSKLSAHFLLSISGLKESSLLANAERLGIPIDRVTLCTDNDEKGLRFAKSMFEKHGIKRHVPKEHKDWNDMLKALKENSKGVAQ